MGQVEGRLEDVNLNVQLLEQEQKVLDSRVSDLKCVANKDSKGIRDEVRVLRSRVEKLEIGENQSRPESGKPRIVTKLFGKMFEKHLESILRWLKDGKGSIIGIWGMGGVGKTTLAKHVHNHLLTETGFRVYWITVSQEFNMQRLQKAIADKVGLTLYDGEDSEEMAVMLSDKLSKLGNVVIIFDDVWRDFSLEEVGVPVGPDGCSLIFTTRSKEVCRKMACKNELRANVLDTDEAWELFKHVLGQDTLLPTGVEEIAKCIAEECAGLPLGISAVAGSMRGVSDIREWRNTLAQINALSVGHDDMEDKVFPLLESSFGRLNKCHQYCLLYCSLYPEDAEMNKEELIHLFIPVGLMDKRKTRKEYYDQGHTILNKLVDVCLLEQTANSECVKMHDLIRDMVLRITSGRSKLTLISMPKFMVKAGMGLEEMPSEEEWVEDLNVVSLMWNSILSEISPNTSPKCPNLSTLILQRTGLTSIPDSFFEHMTGLKILDLSYTNIEKLPDSVSNMVKLTTLWLTSCRDLTYVPPLGRLKELRELSLYDSRIEQVPGGLETLTKLEYLNMRNTEIKSIPERTLSKLSNLKYLDTSHFIKGDDVQIVKQLEGFGGGLASMYDYFQVLKSYKTKGPPDSYLILVHGNPDVENFSFIIPKFSLGDKVLHFSHCRFGNNLKKLFPTESIEHVRLEYCVEIGSCFSDVVPQSNCLSNLHSLELIGLQEIEFVWRLSSLDKQQHLPLEYLLIQELPNLIGLILWEPQQVYESRLATYFCNLRELRVSFCGKMRTLITISSSQSLKNIHKISVFGCEELEEILSIDSNTLLTLPSLEEVILGNLPELKSICNRTISCDFIKVYNCPKVKRLPLSLSSIERLEYLCGSEEWWEGLEWDDPSAKDTLLPKFEKS